MTKSKVKIIRCKDKNEASKKALELLLKTVDKDTLLLLSGGASPDILYKLISVTRRLRPGGIALVDERYGPPMHDNSNEKMISDTGLLSYINNEGIRFYGILKGYNLATSAADYEQIIKTNFKKFSKKIAVMGIGKDGHTAGIKPDLEYDHSKLVVAYDDANGTFGKRITLTFEALSKINEFIVLVFGENKQEGFKKATFYTNNPAKVTILTTLKA